MEDNIVPLSPRESGELIAMHSKDVTVCEDGVKQVTKKVRESIYLSRMDICPI